MQIDQIDQIARNAFSLSLLFTFLHDQNAGRRFLTASTFVYNKHFIGDVVNIILLFLLVQKC